MEVKEVCTGYVLVEINDSNEWVKVGNGKLLIDTSYEPERHAQTKGRVIKFAAVDFYSDFMPDGTEVRWENKLREGDQVIFHFLCVRDAISNGRYFVDSNRKFLYIPYEELYVIIRGVEVIPINGWLLVEPKVMELPKTTLHLPEFIKGKKSVTCGKIKYISCPSDYYINGKWVGADKELNVGDEVVFKDCDAIPIQYELHSDLGVLYRMKYQDAHKVDKFSLQIA